MPLVEVDGLSKHYRPQRLLALGERRVVRAVDGVSFGIAQGRTFGLVGESGCGKSTVARLLLRLTEPTAGAIRFEGRPTIGLRGAGLAALRRQVQMVAQDPYSSLNPSFTVRAILWEGLRRTPDGRRAREARYVELLDMVGLPAAALDRYPHQLSGGQRQRVSIARALSVRPTFIVADEPVSALDVSLQSQILNLLIGIQQELSLTYLFISHDLNVVRYICDEVAVMYLGRIVEHAPAARLFAAPRHPYTQGLMTAIPRPGWTYRRQRPLQGELPDPAAPPAGCRFHPRCPWAADVCRSVDPPLRALPEGSLVACHRAEEIASIMAFPVPAGTPASGEGL